MEIEAFEQKHDKTGIVNSGYKGRISRTAYSRGNNVYELQCPRFNLFTEIKIKPYRLP